MIRKLLLISGLLLWLSQGIAQAPVADFSATPTSGCGPLSVQFKDLSSGSPTFWQWDFGNGQTSSLQNPYITFGAAGTYNVRLIVRNATGSNATEKTGYITVYPYPTAQFRANLTLACAPANIQFTDLSTPGQGSISSWAWDFGDGSTSNQQSPAHVYTQPGYYNVQLKVTNSGGCSNTDGITRYLRIVNGVQPNFTFNQSSASCTAPFTGQLLNQSAGPGNLTYSWTLTNGATPANSSDTSPVVTFPAGGSYNVTLNVASSLGCSQSITKTLPFGNNTAAFNGPSTVCLNSPATFTNTSTPAPVSMSWDFGDHTGSTSSPATKTWTTTGTFPVKLVNKYTVCADSVIQNVAVVNPPAPVFIISPTTATACKPPLTVNFTDQTNPTPTAWLWDFGDGQTSTQQSPSHTYTTTGTFTVKLTVTGPGGCTNTTTQTGLVQVAAPTVTISGTLTACTSSTANFRVITPVANITAVDGVTAYAWSAPGSNEGSSTSTNPTFTYAATGSYTLSLTVTTTGGCTATATAGIQIGTPLVASFTISPSSSVCNTTPITFTSTTPGPPQNWIWDFGDHTGIQVIGTPTATHQYGNNGPHNVTLTVVNNGCQQQAVQTVDIDPPFSAFGFNLDKTAGCSNKSLIQFTDSSIENPNTMHYGNISWSWDFGDPASGANNTSTLQNPEHLYPSPGPTPKSYTVTFTITQGLCTSTIQHTVTIGDITAAFTIPLGTICRNTPVTLTSSSTPASLINAYSWQIDALPATPQSATPSYVTSFNTNGTHSVTLTVYDVNNCPYTSPTNNITVSGPTAKFSVPATGGGCQNAPVTFTDLSTPNPAPITTWSWNFGDGKSQTYPPATQPFTHQYTDTGNYQPLLTITDAAGCTDTSSQPVQITSPTANFSGPDSFYCPGVPLTFIDSSQGYGLTENWNFGDGASAPTPVHSYATSGQTYNVTLTVTDKNNCSSSKTESVRIQQPIAAFNIYDTTAICTPQETIFAAHGQYYDSLYWNFGDGSSSTLDSTSHFYNNYGTDTAKLFLQGPGGCLDSASRRVLVVNPYATTGFNYGPPLSGCDSVPVQFNLVPPPYTTFSLHFGDNNYDSSQNTTPFHTYRNPGNYAPIMVLTDASGCIVNMGGASAITVLGATPFFSVNKHDFCDTGTVIFTDFTISNDGLATETYMFGDGSPNQSLSPGTGNFDATNDYTKPGLWTATLQVTTNSGCVESYSDTIHIYRTPHPVITIPSITCTGLIQFQGSTAIPTTDSIAWDWSFGNGKTSQVQDPALQMAPGNYVVLLRTTVPFGCSDTTSSPVTINPLPVIKGPHVITTPVGIPVTIPFTYSPNIATYLWTPTDNLDCPTCANPTATIIYATTYSVTVTDANSCSASDTILIKTICNEKNYWFPNTFSPNGDGVNDYFYPRGTSLYNVQSLTIFNRWGQMVFQRRDFPANAQNMGWDGTFAGKPAPSDAYVYIAQVVCENAQVVVLSGNVTLIR